ncbi:GPO family capsid scaffolding protein [Dyella sp. 2RAB6]|uniref:GPO family capsid scaffolding protein n=1 Tax=Dyella sp. 2RAB6 TaxID=3232992 RepID=UPI003F916839
MAKSKFFRVAVEGATTDGRTMAKLTTKAKSNDAQLADVAAAMDGLTEVVESFAERDTALVTELSTLKERLATIERNATTAQTEFAALRTQLSQTEAAPRRPAATGGNGTAQTDC